MRRLLPIALVFAACAVAGTEDLELPPAHPEDPIDAVEPVANMFEPLSCPTDIVPFEHAGFAFTAPMPTVNELGSAMPVYLVRDRESFETLARDLRISSSSYEEVDFSTQDAVLCVGAPAHCASTAKVTEIALSDECTVRVSCDIGLPCLDCTILSWARAVEVVRIPKIASDSAEVELAGRWDPLDCTDH